MSTWVVDVLFLRDMGGLGTPGRSLLYREVVAGVCRVRWPFRGRVVFSLPPGYDSALT